MTRYELPVAAAPSLIPVIWAFIDFIACKIMTYLTFLRVVDLFAVLLFLASVRAIHDYRRRGGLSYPPGPRPLPILGNLLEIPKDSPWLAYTQFSKKYGDIMSFRVFGQVIVVLNSIKVAKDLLERNGDTYSDRPIIPFYDMMGWQWALPMARGDERWRQGRKLLDRGLRPSATASRRPMLETRTRLLLSRLLTNPHQWEVYIDLFQGESILAMTYGYVAREHDDRIIAAAKRMNKFGGDTLFPGALLVNYLPFLRHIPEWVPLLSYKPLARIGYNLGNEVLYPPLQFVKESIVRDYCLDITAYQMAHCAHKLCRSSTARLCPRLLSRIFRSWRT